MKKLSVFLLVMVLAFGVFCTSAQAADNIKITVNGTNVAFTDAKPFVDQNGRTQVPMRALGEALGCDVNYQKIEGDVDLTEVITVSKTTPKNLIKFDSLYLSQIRRRRMVKGYSALCGIPRY